MTALEIIPLASISIFPVLGSVALMRARGPMTSQMSYALSGAGFAGMISSASLPVPDVRCRIGPKAAAGASVAGTAARSADVLI